LEEISKPLGVFYGCLLPWKSEDEGDLLMKVAKEGVLSNYLRVGLCMYDYRTRGVLAGEEALASNSMIAKIRESD
jgi:hypothetical protein